MKDMPEDLRRVIEIARVALRSKSKLKRTRAIKAIDDLLSRPERQPSQSINFGEALDPADAVPFVRPETVTTYDDLLGRRRAGDFRVEDEITLAARVSSTDNPEGSSV